MEEEHEVRRKFLERCSSGVVHDSCLRQFSLEHPVHRSIQQDGLVIVPYRIGAEKIVRSESKILERSRFPSSNLHKREEDEKQKIANLARREAKNSAGVFPVRISEATNCHEVLVLFISPLCLRISLLFLEQQAA
eukprot:scaffold23479_cov143-Cylindrotheca_fusiformis.AAC.9